MLRNEKVKLPLQGPSSPLMVS